MKRKALLSTVLVLCVSCVSTAPPSKVGNADTEAEIQYQGGVAAMSKGNWELAKFNLLKAVRLNPRSPKVHYALGTTLMYLPNQLENARLELTETLRLDSSFADAYNNLGVVYLREEKWDEAIKILEKALEELDYQTPENANTNIGFAYLKKNDLQKAVEYLNRALSMDPENPRTRSILAEVYMKAGRMEKAREVLLKILDRNPGDFGAHYLLGTVFYKNRENAKAKEEFSIVIKLAPESEEAGRARSYLDLID